MITNKQQTTGTSLLTESSFRTSLGFGGDLAVLSAGDLFLDFFLFDEALESLGQGF